MSEKSYGFTFQLSEPIEAVVGGETAYFTEVHLSSPTSRNMKEAAQLRQLVSRSQFDIAAKVTAMFGDASERADAAKEAKEAVDNDSVEELFDGDACLTALRASNDPYDVTLSIAKKLLTSGVATISKEPSIKLNTLHLNEMSLDEFENLVGAYCARFLGTSQS
jgi:hypothetical protein